MNCPSLAVVTALESAEGAGKAGCRLAPTIRCAKNLHTQMRRRDNRWAGKHPAFPARWVDGVCALSPEPSSFWPPSPCELAMPETRSSPDSSPQGLTVATTVRTTRFCRTQLHPAPPKEHREGVGAVRLHAAGPHEVHLALVSHSRARRSRVHRTPIHVRYDVRSPLSEDRDGETMPQFRISVKWNIFAKEG